MHVRRRGGIIATLLGIGLLMGLASSAAASDVRAAREVTVGPDEVITDDLYVAAGTTRVEGTIDGDVSILGGTIDITGTVKGSVNVVSGTATISGPVGGAVRVVGGTATLSGTIGRDLVLVGGSVNITGNGEVAGDVVGAAGTLTLDGSVAGRILAALGELNVNGSAGSIDANVGQLRIRSGAMISGDVRYASEHEAEIASGATVTGLTERRNPDWSGFDSVLPGGPITTFIGGFLGLLILGWGLMVVRPDWVTAPGNAIAAQPVQAIGLGFAAWIGQFVLVVVLAALAALATWLAAAFGGALAIPFLVVLLAMIGLVFLSQVYVAMAIGTYAERIGIGGSDWMRYLFGALAWAAVIGVVATLVSGLGGLLFAAGWILGMGGLMLSTIDGRRGPAPTTSATSTSHG